LTDKINLTDSTDAKIWAQEFMKIWQEEPIDILDEDLMLGWFANAIMAGYDSARRKYEMVNFHDFLMQSIKIQFDEAVMGKNVNG
jgi:hypothetical protein